MEETKLSQEQILSQKDKTVERKKKGVLLSVLDITGFYLLPTLAFSSFLTIFSIKIDEFVVTCISNPLQEKCFCLDIPCKTTNKKKLSQSSHYLARKIKQLSTKYFPNMNIWYNLY